MPSIEVERLLIALNASIPPSILAVLLNAMLVDKTYKPFKLIGELLSSSLRDVLRRIYVVCNVVFTIVWVSTFVWNCRLNAPDLMNESYCLPVQSLSAVTLLVLLWVDRITLAFLHAPCNSGFTSRLARGATCVGFIMAVSEKEPSIWFLFVCILNRYSASISLAERLKAADTLARICIICILLHSFFLNTSSRKILALCLMCTLHAR